MSFGAYWAGARPALARHDEQNQHQVDLQAARRKAANLVGTRNATLAQVAAVNAELANLPLRLEPASTVNHRLAALTALFKDCRLNIDKTRAGTAVDVGDYQAVPIVITGTGTYPAFARFLHRVRKAFPDTAVRSFETANNSASAESPTATFQVDLVWHAAKG
jgi:Tfp pilus assembly protein PilO